MKKLAVFCGSIILSTSVLAQESEVLDLNDYSNQSGQESLVKAPQNAIKAASEICRSWAQDDEIDKVELASYLLNCVNEELKYEGYSPVVSID